MAMIMVIMLNSRMIALENNLKELRDRLESGQNKSQEKPS